MNATVQKSVHIGDTGTENWQRWCVVGSDFFCGWYDSREQAEQVLVRLATDGAGKGAV